MKIKQVTCTRKFVAKCYKAYQEELRRSEAMDFDDLIMLTLRLFDQKS